MLLTSSRWREARDAAQHPILHRTFPYDKELPGLHVSGAKVEELQDERIGKDLFQTQKKCLVASEHRLKYSILLAVNEMENKVIFYYCAGVLKEFNT